MSGQSCQCDECQVSRRQEPATHFTDDATLARVAELERENAELRKDAARLKAVFHRHRKACHLHSVCPPNWKEWLDDVDAAIASEKENMHADAMLAERSKP